MKLAWLSREALNVVWTRDTKSNPRAADRSDDPLSWVLLILAVVLALIVVVETATSVRGVIARDQTKVTDG